MSQPAMDAAAFAEVKTLMGESLNDIIQLTLETLPEQLNLLKQAVNLKNAEQIFSLAHKIKSASGTIGALGLAKNAEQIELIGRAGATDIPAALMQALTVSIEEVNLLLKKELK